MRRPITGGASGLGAATCRLPAERGAHVVVCDLDAAHGAAPAEHLITNDDVDAESVRLHAGARLGPRSR